MAYFHIQCSLSEFMSRITWREYLLRLDWLNRQQNNPTVDQHYYMQIAEQLVKIRWMFTDKDCPVKDLKDMVIKFGPSKPVEPKVIRNPNGKTYAPGEVQNIMAKQVVMRRLGINPKNVRVVQG